MRNTPAGNEVRQAGFRSCGPTRRSKRREGPPNLKASRGRGRMERRTTSTVVACSNAGMAQTRREIRRDSLLHVLTQPFPADKGHSYETNLMLQSMALDRWSQVTIYVSYERGKRNPDLATAMSLSVLYDLTLNKLFPQQVVALNSCLKKRQRMLAVWRRTQQR